ncbi:hypothetical protein SLEP1_g60550 [Rubroshorea leprosula]|uniref:Uncharacterized protein n=1 Tax=Rubroshorea leprosula TaxID=152421 RepID=A0AAV5MW40_9ROSI|nr:hypothetical protein SLEP1_g60550 [Rubroshorea leprosula]
MHATVIAIADATPLNGQDSFNLHHSSSDPRNQSLRIPNHG